MNKISVILVLSFVIFAVVPIAHATGIIGITDGSGSVAFLIGNSSQTYNLTVNITTNESQYLKFNVTFILPYGLQNNSICHGETSPTPVLWTCTIIYTPINGSGILQANLSVKTNVSAYPTYGNQTINFSLVGENSTANSTLKSVRGVNFWRNPRPQSPNPQQGNVFFRFIDWRQIDPTYKVMAPIWTFNASANRPIVASNTYGDVMYFDKSFFEQPTYMRLWGYNISFRIIFNEMQNYTFLMSSPINNSVGSSAELQGLMPLLIQSVPQQDMKTNVTYNMTLGVPAQSGFTVYVNNTPFTDTALRSSYGLNITFSGGDQSVLLLTINATTANVTLINNTEIYVMFTTANFTACNLGSSCQTSPIFVKTQNNAGLNFDEPPKFGQSLNISFLINVTNLLPNYTLNNLHLSFMQPMNVTMNDSGTVKQFNMTIPTNVKMLVWNSSATWEENLSVSRNDSNFSFTDSLGPAEGASVNVFVSTFNVNISTNIATFSNWDPGTGGSGYAYLNFTAEMAFPTMDETAVPSGSAGTNNSYNITTNSPTRSRMNITDKVPGFNSSSTNINITINGVQLNSANYTVGSLLLNDVQAGSSTISVSYNVPAAST